MLRSLTDCSMCPAVTVVKDTADDAAQRPDSDAEASQVDALAVDVRLHLEREQRLNQDVERPDPEGQHRPHQVHGEQRGLLRLHTHTQIHCRHVRHFTHTHTHTHTHTTAVN